MEKLKERFVVRPGKDIVIDTDKAYSVKDSIIQIDGQDIKMIIQDAENVVMLEGKANGRSRSALAMEDAALHIKKIAAGYDLFSAKKVLLLFVYGKKHQMMLGDAPDIVQFAEMFGKDTTFIWGISETKDIKDDTMYARIIAANLDKSADYVAPLYEEKSHSSWFVRLIKRIWLYLHQ